MTAGGAKSWRDEAPANRQQSINREDSPSTSPAMLCIACHTTEDPGEARSIKAGNDDYECNDDSR
eukprot:CAMPEP_0183434576 /NCGR_PEP_ID=MMETSP0370-20130417/63851_1 /TAXON_ID=268820 /ORGANISM="Peridinium aciculiferum, Strain PAER-2" /LENGTH=64 /DNA_ID=CAMNT_0025621295 /DNA_START=117 /DNA_END=309 /DNA_ORIENTATION=-